MNPPARRPIVRRKITRALGWALGLLLLGAAGIGSAQAPPPPTPIITLERSDLIGGVPVPVTLWFIGRDAQSVAEVLVTFRGPDFIALRGPSAAAAPATLGPFEGSGPFPLALTTEGPLREGRFTLAFGIRYTVEGSPATHAAVIEKAVEVGLLGVGSVAGVPLQFAAYLLPGLIAVMVIRVLKVGWSQQLQALELAAISFLLSMLLLVVAERLAAWPAVAAWGHGSIDILVLGIGGALVGLALSTPKLIRSLHDWLARKGEERAAADLTAVDDDFATIVGKAFRQSRYAASGKAVLVRTNGGETFAGSVAARAAGGGIVLLGWQKLKEPPDPALQRLAAAGDWPTLATRLDQRQRHRKLALEPYNQVRREADDDWLPAGERETFAEADVKSVELVDFAKLGLAGSGFPIELG